MITLAKKIKEEKEKKEKGQGSFESPKGSRISVRDKLLTKGLKFSRLLCLYSINSSSVLATIAFTTYKSRQSLRDLM